MVPDHPKILNKSAMFRQRLSIMKIGNFMIHVLFISAICEKCPTLQYQ